MTDTIKNFEAFITDDFLTITYNKRAILKNIKVKLNLENEKKTVLFVAEKIEDDDAIKITFKREPELPFYMVDIDSVILFAKEEKDVLMLSLDVKFSKVPSSSEYMFSLENSIEFNYELGEKTKGKISHYMFTSSWINPSFEENQTKVVSLSADFADYHMNILPLVNYGGSCKLNENGAYINVTKYGVNSFNDAFMSVSMGKNPYDAICENFEVCKENKLIETELRKDKVLPDMFNYFGWCTWDACYHNVSSELLYKKLDEFKEKNIKVKWVLIDDGWSLYTSGEDEESSALLSFKEDRKKFPEGLKACIKRIKEEYGVEYVGVWQSFTGYWKGISKNSEIIKEFPNSVMKIFSQRMFPAFDKDGAYTFWNSWHKYLKEQGVDFVKVDTQGSFNFKFIGENVGVYEGLKIQYEALEKSVFENFEGRVINCMGMGNENCFARNKMALNRNSNDFFPKQEDGFISHCFLNVYNVPYHSMLHWCDFDMWWSEHETAKQSAVLRGISGGPIYTSDEVGHSDSLYITPLCDENAKIYELDDFAKPTFDCYYVDCAKEAKPLKVYNKKDNKYVVAVFGMSDKVSKGELKLSDFGAKGSFIAEEYFSSELLKLDDESSVSLSLSKNECLLYNIYPVDKNSEAHLGRKDKFIGIGTETVRTIKACDI